MHVTFDSNVWRPLVSPATFPKHVDAWHFDVIRQAASKELIFGFLAETILTLEAIKRSDRKVFFGNYKAAMKISTTVKGDDETRTGFSIGPSQIHHTNNNLHLEKHFDDARLLGFKLLRIPRIGGLKNIDIKRDDYATDDRFPSNDRQDRCGEIAGKIEARGCGISHIQKFGAAYAIGKPWTAGIKAAPQIKKAEIVKAIAEWADGDAVAAHYAYGTTFFARRMWLEPPEPIRFYHR